MKSAIGSDTAQIAQINCTKAAIKLYLIIAKTGQLPEELPDNLPQDPDTGRDLLYRLRDYGFVLGCQSDMFKKGKERFAFITQREN